MIRPAKFIDVPRIVELMGEMHRHSKYAFVDEVDEAAAHKLVAAFVQRHGGSHDGATLVMVSETEGKVVEGFMLGALDRVYHIGKRLSANDVFLYVSDYAPRTDALRMFEAYMSWATNNPKVAVIKASYTDAIEGAGRMVGVYERKGFHKIGEIFERLNETEDMAMPAMRALEGVGG